MALLMGSGALAGSAGVSDGSLSGRVLGPDGMPVANAFVVAQRTDQDPKVIRSTRTDSQGRWYLGVPTGSFILGFSAMGFQTIDTAQGDTNNRTALGAQVRAFVEPGRNSLVQDVTLQPAPPRTTGTVVVHLTDSVTGEPVEQATVIVGASATSQAGPGGTFRLEVPARVNEEGQLDPVPVEIQADGFDRFATEVKVVPEAEQRVTLPVQPRLVVLSGFVDLDPTLDPERVQEIQVLASGVPDAISQGRVVDAGGYFEVMVPASTASRIRTFDLRFVLEGAGIASLSNVAAPRAGARNVSASPVRIQAVKTQVAGSVISRDGSIPQGGRIMQATLVELGRAVPVSGGNFVLTGVPVGRPLTLQVVVENPTTGRIETAEVQFTAVDGGADGGPFNLAPIVTQPR